MYFSIDEWAKMFKKYLAGEEYSSLDDLGHNIKALSVDIIAECERVTEKFVKEPSMLLDENIKVKKGE